MTEQSFEEREASLPVDDVEGVQPETGDRDAERRTDGDQETPVEADDTDAFRQ